MLIPLTYPRLMIGVFMFMEHLHGTVSVFIDTKYRHAMAALHPPIITNEATDARHNWPSMWRMDTFSPPVTLYFDRIIHYTGNGQVAFFTVRCFRSRLKKLTHNKSIWRCFRIPDLQWVRCYWKSRQEETESISLLWAQLSAVLHLIDQ